MGTWFTWPRAFETSLNTPTSDHAETFPLPPAALAAVEKQYVSFYNKLQSPAPAKKTLVN